MGAVMSVRQQLIHGLEQLVAEVADKVCAAMVVPPLGEFVAAQCRTEITEFVDTLLTAYSESPHTPAEDRLAAAQKLLAAARDAGDRQAMLSAHDAVERAAAEVAGQ